MTTSTFRQLVAEVAARAKEKLPQTVNGRLESAVKLVLLHDVMPQADGSILVGSSRDPLQSYLLVGTACECQDFVHGQAPDGWCQHRIAAGIAKRVGELLPPEPPPVLPDLLEPWPDNDVEEPPPAPAPQPAPAPLPEAPASVNVRLTIAGREVQWTLRDLDEARLATRLEALLARYPVPQAAPQAPSQPQGQGQGQAWCQKHQVAMQLNQKDGRSWYSHRTEQGWCKGK